MTAVRQAHPWTAEEERIVWSAHTAGKSSPQISLLLHERSAGAVRNRIRTLIRQNRVPAGCGEDEDVIERYQTNQEEHTAQSHDSDYIVGSTDVDVRDSTDTAEGSIIFLSDTYGVTYPVPKAARLWSPDEDARLMHLYLAGYRDQYLADKLRGRTSTECLIRSQLLISATAASMPRPSVEMTKQPQYIALIDTTSSDYSSDSDEGRFGNTVSESIFSPTPVDAEMKSQKKRQSQGQPECALKKEPASTPDLSDRPKRGAFNDAIGRLSNMDWGRGLASITRKTEASPSAHKAKSSRDRSAPAELDTSTRKKLRGTPPMEKVAASSTTTPPPTGVKRPASAMLSDGIPIDAVPEATAHEIMMTLKDVNEQIRQRDKRIAELKKEIETLKKMSLLAEKDIEILALEEQKQSLIRERSSDGN